MGETRVNLEPLSPVIKARLKAAEESLEEVKSTSLSPAGIKANLFKWWGRVIRGEEKTLGSDVVDKTRY